MKKPLTPSFCEVHGGWDESEATAAQPVQCQTRTKRCKCLELLLLSLNAMLIVLLAYLKVSLCRLRFNKFAVGSVSQVAGVGKSLNARSLNW